MLLSGAGAYLVLLSEHPRLEALILLTLLFVMFLVFWRTQKEQQNAKNRVHEETLRLLAAQEESNRQLQQANRQLQDSEQKLSVTLNSIGDAVIATDAQARVTLLNPVAQQLTG